VSNLGDESVNVSTELAREKRAENGKKAIHQHRRGTLGGKGARILKNSYILTRSPSAMTLSA
jgi:hypothetical protein